MFRPLFLGGIGLQEILVILLIVLLFYGGKKVPEMMRGLGQGVKAFKDGMESPLPTSPKGEGCSAPAGRVGGRSYAELLERVPLSAGRAFAYPFRTLLSAVVADVHDFVLRHRLNYLTCASI